MPPTPERRRAQDILRILAEGTAAQTGESFFRSLAKHAARALGARFAFVAESLSEMESRSLAYWEGADFGAGFSYRFPGTPCQRVAQGHVCSTATRLRELYPEDRWLTEIGADSYVGVPMVTATGKVLGHIAVLHTEPMETSAEDVSILRIFAARACAELERVQAERALRTAMEEVGRLRERLQAENAYLKEEIRAESNFEDMIGRSAAIRNLSREIERVAASDSTVLVIGETGSGKELVARALHARSPRRERPLVKVNCGAISAGLVESELFGHVKGAFTGALAARIGRFELANEATLFLDEVGELPEATQVKLLRVMQEREFEPVGSSETRRVDVRIIAATNRDPEEAVRTGRFRRDFYYRLNVLQLRVPPLRERREDVSLLASYFLERAARRLGSAVRGFASETLRRLEAYDWPGNVRELQNVIERAAVLSRGPLLTLDHEVFFAPPRAVPPAEAPEPAPGARPLPSLGDLRREHIRSALEAADWVVEGPSGAAKALGLSPSTVRSRMKKLGLSRARAEAPDVAPPREESP